MSPHGGQPLKSRMRHPTVGDVADDRDPPALEISEGLPKGDEIEQALGRVLMAAIPGTPGEAGV